MEAVVPRRVRGHLRLPPGPVRDGLPDDMGTGCDRERDRDGESGEHGPHASARLADGAASLAEPVDALRDRFRLEPLQKVLRVRPARLRQQGRASEPRQELGELLGVARLVEEIGAEDEVPRRRAEERLGLAPADAGDTHRRAVPLGVAAEELDRVLGPVGREHLRAAERDRQRRQAEAAAELDDALPVQLEAGDVTREGEPARPELGPVGEKLLLVERRFVDELLGARRPQDGEPQTGCELDLVLDEVQGSGSAAKRSTGTPSGSLTWA
jgi:hypothetical protein